VAYEVRLKWDKHPQNEEGEELTGLDEIPVLMPHESASIMAGRPSELFKKYPEMRFEGTIEFKDVVGKRRTQRFVCSADEHRKRLFHDDEMVRTLYDLQQIPKKLDDISEAIRGRG
jgi:hypothetical protein